jgi:tRNA-guanine family transglycosylase
MKGLKDGQTTLKKFLGFENYMTYLTVVDATAPKKNLGTSKDTTIKIFNNGYKEFSLDTFHSMLDAMRPDVIVSMTENPEAETAGQKGNKRAIQKNINFLDATLKFLKDTTSMTKVYGAVQYTKLEDLFEKSCKETTNRTIAGLVLQGLCQNESLADRELFFQRLFKNIDNSFGLEKPLVLSSFGEPCDVLHALQFGINSFEVEYPFALAEKGLASLYTTEGEDPTEHTITIVLPTERMEEEKHHLHHELFKDKKARHIDLFDEKYREMLAPVQEKCDCYSCANHTMAYIHHLVKNSEMTGFLLLTIHNVHLYSKLVSKISKLMHDKVLLKHYITWFLKYQTN